MNNKIINTTFAAIVAVGITGALIESPTAVAASKTSEKCYGVVADGKNACGTSKHACGGLAKTPNDPEEWKYVPKGTCEKMGGKLTPPKK